MTPYEAQLEAMKKWRSTRKSVELFEERQYPGVNLNGPVAGIHPCEYAPGENYDHDFKVDVVGCIGPDEVYGYVCNNCGLVDPEPYEGCDYYE